MHELRTNYEQTTNKICTDYERTTNGLRTNLFYDGFHSQTTNKLRTNYEQTTNYLRTNYERTCFVMASVSERKVMEMSRLKAQLTEVATEFPKLRAHIG